ncbi:hypothetical protein D3C71_1822140 [compost metagenome]
MNAVYDGMDILRNGQRAVPFHITDAEASAQVHYLKQHVQLAADLHRKAHHLLHGKLKAFHLENLGADVGVQA